jgi:hypothetical protein
MANSTNQIVVWLHRYGGSPWRFNIKMLTCINVWKLIDYDYLFETVVESKGCSICHYSLVPFFVKYLGLDIRCVYKDAVEKNKFSIEEYNFMLAMFPSQFSVINSESLLENIGFTDLKPTLLEIRKRLSHQNITMIESIEVQGHDVQKVINFDEEFSS